MRIISNKDTNSKATKRILTFGGIVLGIYIIGTVLFTFITLPNTHVNGKNVSFAPKESVIGDSVGDFDIKFKGLDDKNLSFNSKDVDYKANIPKGASLDQNPLKWPISFITKEDFEFDYKVNYDEDKLDEILKKSQFMKKVVEPKDAKLEFDGKEFKIKEEVKGNKVKYNKLKKEAISAIKTRNADIDMDESFYERPKVFAKDKNLQKALKDANEALKLSYKFNINGFDKKIEGETLADMIDFKDKKLTLNYDKLNEYVSKLSQQTDTYGKNRKFNATDVGQITVNPGVYGFKMNVEETVNTILKKFDEKKSANIDPVYEREGFERYDNGSDLKDTYVEVDLSRQHLWYYKNGELLISTPVVTGDAAHQAFTNVGVGSIMSKEMNKDLRGTNFDGSNYVTPVKYWMPIGWDGEGLHDAGWRSTFGSNYYTFSGSNGCVNMPPAQAAKLYELVEINTPVVVYESSTNNSPNMLY
ncbi:L,D-transpeptidase family protein [Anaerococcus hydrogenalis]|uniref:L,D-transpeptidase family protein n=1 Tax=Anaerococcus hydrogenalis TaxID=33029 RepID=UPI0023F2F18F|nr:L,D-transpeptidase family protein [Anaerococcus hydrogenalis]